MKHLFFIILVIIFLSTTNANASKPVFFNDWSVQSSEWYITALTTNEKGNTLFQTCYYIINKCTYKLMLDTSCKQDYQALITPDGGDSSSIVLGCGGGMGGSSGYYEYFIKGVDINNIVLNAKNVSFVLKMENDETKVERFNLDGASDAMKYMLKIYNSSKKDKERIYKANKEKEKKVRSSYNWVNYEKDKDGNVFSYAKQKIEKEGIVQVWDKKVYSNKGRDEEIQSRIKDEMLTEGYDKLSSKDILREIDCKQLKTRLLRITEYDTAGNTLFNANYNESEWKDITAGSIIDFIRGKVCVTSKKPLKKRTVNK